MSRAKYYIARDSSGEILLFKDRPTWEPSPTSKNPKVGMWFYGRDDKAFLLFKLPKNSFSMILKGELWSAKPINEEYCDSVSFGAVKHLETFGKKV